MTQSWSHHKHFESRKVADKYRLIYDSAVEDRFLAHKEDRIVKFPYNEQSLYVHNSGKMNLIMMNTVKNNKSKFFKIVVNFFAIIM